MMAPKGLCCEGWPPPPKKGAGEQQMLPLGHVVVRRTSCAGFWHTPLRKGGRQRPSQATAGGSVVVAAAALMQQEPPVGHEWAVDTWSHRMLSRGDTHDPGHSGSSWSRAGCCGGPSTGCCCCCGSASGGPSAEVQHTASGPHDGAGRTRWQYWESPLPTHTPGQTSRGDVADGRALGSGGRGVSAVGVATVTLASSTGAVAGVVAAGSASSSARGADVSTAVPPRLRSLGTQQRR